MVAHFSERVDALESMAESLKKRIVYLKAELKVVRNSFPFSITTELYERFTRL